MDHSILLTHHNEAVVYGACLQVFFLLHTNPDANSETMRFMIRESNIQNKRRYVNMYVRT